MTMRLATLSLAILLAGCTHYRYIDPQTPEGLACLHKLDANVNACEAEVKVQQDNFDGVHEFQARNTQQCEHFNKSNTPNACPPVPSRTTVANYCRDNYREKFTACGGRIEKIEQ